ncbi:hypothetical protein CTRI78_v002397 [Colletotrichum trifolii]|uniref:Uncharacterized protein n=1 Tax=Colletotrichum trifolii TaxID=5466 RepID=A0A4V3HX09_COLTR|nr:hypothetical protein CTRI78_v002397 [Colletotrichum trifolii]
MDVREAYLHLFSLWEKLDAADLQGYWASVHDRAASSAEDYSGGICGPRSRCNVSCVIAVDASDILQAAPLVADRHQATPLRLTENGLIAAIRDGSEADKLAL